MTSPSSANTPVPAPGRARARYLGTLPNRPIRPAARSGGQQHRAAHSPPTARPAGCAAGSAASAPRYRSWRPRAAGRSGRSPRHQHHRRDERALAAEPVADVPEQHAPDRAGMEADANVPNASRVPTTSSCAGKRTASGTPGWPAVRRGRRSRTLDGGAPEAGQQDVGWRPAPARRAVTARGGRHEVTSPWRTGRPAVSAPACASEPAGAPTAHRERNTGSTPSPTHHASSRCGGGQDETRRCPARVLGDPVGDSEWLRPARSRRRPGPARCPPRGRRHLGRRPSRRRSSASAADRPTRSAPTRS